MRIRRLVACGVLALASACGSDGGDDAAAFDEAAYCAQATETDAATSFYVSDLETALTGLRGTSNALRALAELAPAKAQSAHDRLASASEELLAQIDDAAPRTLADLEEVSTRATAELEESYGDLTAETAEVAATVKDLCGIEISVG